MELVVYGILCPPGREREAAYRLLELALERERGISPLPELARGVRGKPFFPSLSGVHFNLSHSRGAAVCALHDAPVGVDVERLRQAPRRLAAGMEDAAFFRLWTGREATIKREGRGVEALLRPVAPDPLCRWLENFLPGYAAAVCPSRPEAPRLVQVEASELFRDDFA
ncbi:MAG: hypothetical protein K2P20_00825 [Oscillospiraceae bacterium]|nr:hypothetical protein [Oscillospiraceae bacterium]